MLNAVPRFIMKILFFGDVIGRPGREALKKILPVWREKYSPDAVIINGENLAHGFGVTEKTIKEILDLKIDLITSGNHIWQHKESAVLLGDKKIPLIRPANYPPGVPGAGYKFFNIGKTKILVANFIGRVFMKQNFDCPLRVADKILKKEGKKADLILFDFHAEATAEKISFGFYLDGRVSAVLGTHTHVPTADLRILPKGTAYVTDVGMVGPHYSSIGLQAEPIIKNLLTQIPSHPKPDVAPGPVEINAVLLDFGKKGKVEKFGRLRKIVDILPRTK